MFNYTQGFPLVEDRPSAGLLSLNAYTPAQVLSAYDGDNLEFLDSSKVSDPLYWNRGEIKKAETYNEWFAIQQALGTLEGNLTGISDQYLGIANEPLKGAALRQLVGKAPLTPWRWSDSELTDEALAQDQKELNTLLEAEQGIDITAIPVDQLTENQNLIRRLASKFAYVEAEKKAKDKLGFNWLDLLDAQDIFGISLSDRELAGDTKDIEERLSRFDPNFDPQSWFASKFSDEIVTRGLIENGITPDLVSDAPNEDAAFMRIMSRLSITDLQRRASSYTPTLIDKNRLLMDTIVTGVINSPDTIPSVVAELGLAGIATVLGSPVAGAVTLGATSALTSALGGTSVFMRLKKAYDAVELAGKTMKVAGYAAETLYKMPIGIMPSYVKNFGLIRGTAASFTFGAVQGGMAEYARQQREIAFGASTLYATPNAMTDYNLSLVATSALESGAVFGTVFGMGGGLLRSGVGALQNRMSGVLIDPVTGVRNIADQRFTFENTPLGNTIDNIRNFVGKEERALIDAPVPDKLAAESVLNKTNVTADDLVAGTEARVDRIETREAARSPDAARSTPEDAGTRRYEGETIAEYVSRVAPNRAIRNIYEIVSEIARRTPTEGGLRLIESSEQFDNMSIQDQMRVLFNSKKVLDDAKKAETDSVGLPKERERLYDELEKSRKSWFARLKKKLPKAAFKALKEELEENKKASGRKLPELLKEARNTAKSAAERKAASDELAARLLETASAMAAAPDREAAIRASVPPEVLDSIEAAVVEQHLTGTISDETADSIIRNIAGEEVETKLSPLNRVARAAKNAITVAKISPDRVKKIKAIIKDPDSFVSVVDGDKDNALRFFDFANELVLNDMISAVDRDLLLASTVHLNFSSKAFNIQFAIESVLENGKIQPDIVGIFRRRNNSIVMNSDFTGTTDSIKRRRAKTLLHELGHAYFAHEASGANYLDALRLYNKTILTSGVELMRVRPDTTDPLLDSAFLGQYHMQNAEEMFVQTFSQILFSEAEAAINTFSPSQVSRARNVLDKLATNITLAAAMFNKSKYYNAAKDIIDSITDVDSKLKDRVSMPTLARTYSKLYPMFDTVTDAAEYNKKIDAEFPNQDMKPYHLNQAEVDVFTKTKGDPSFIVAMTIMKADRRSFIDANGNFTKSIVDLVKAYNDYKTTQLTSMQIKIAFLVGSLDYKKIEALDKFDRLDFIKDELFSIYSRTIFKGKSKRTLVPATYEDLDALKNLDTMDYLDPTGNSVPYAVGFFGTSGETLINAIASTQPKGKALVADALSADDVAKLVGAMRTDTALTTNLIDRLRIYLDNIGLPELANVVTEVNHLAYIERLKTEGMLDVEPSTPIWPNKKVASTSLALMLKEKLSVEQIKVMLKANLSSSTYSYITNKYSTPKKLLGAVSKLIDEDGLVFNEDSQRWGIKLTSAKPKVTAEAQAKAINFETTVLTKDSLMGVIARIGEKYSKGTDTDEYFTEALASMVMPKEQAKELGGIAGNLELILSKIENGSLATVKDLVNYIHATANNLRKNQQKKAPEVKATAADRIVTTKKDIRFTILSEALAFNTATQGRLLTPQEIELIRVFNESSSMAEAGAKLKRSARTAGNYRAKLIAKITDVFEQASIRLDSDRAAIAAALNKHFDTVASVVDKSKPDTEKKVTSKVTEAKSKPEKNPVEAGARMAQTAALAEKLRNKNPDPVPVPVPANTETVLYKVTDEVTGNEPEKVLRPSEQADAIIHGSQTATKEAVQFTPKKPLPMDFGTSEELASQPEKLAGVLKSASRLGFDALVFKDSSVIPINIEELPVVGKTIIKKEADAPAEVEITTVDKTPVLNVISKPRQPATPKSKKDSFPVKVQKVRVPKVKATSAAPETTGPRIPTPSKKEVPVEPIESDVVKTPETDAVERKINEDPALLRQAGMDSNFLKTFIKKYWESKIEADSGTTMTPMFKNMWAHFVNVNQYIADANKLILGDDIMDKFWKAVDRLRTESLLRKVTEGPAGKKPLSYRQMLEKAAEEIKVDGKPDFVIPLLPEEIKFVKVNAEGDYRLSARSKKAKDIIDAAGEDPKLPGPPKADAIIREGEGQPELPIKIEEEPPTPKETIIDNKINQSEAGTSRLLRFNNMVGTIFGGNQRDSKSWWENLMNKSTNATQGASALGKTVRSTVDRLSFISRFFDDTRTQTAHLIGAGKTAFKTAMQLRSEEGRLMTRIFREYSKLHNIVPKLTNDVRVKLDMYVYESLYKNRQPNKADLVALGVPVHLAQEVAKQASMVIKSSQIANRNILELETQTGRMSIVDENGNPVSHLTYAPVQLDHEGLARLDQNSRAALIKAMVTARTNRKLNDPMLDMNTMIVMGWLDVAFDEDAKTLSVFASDRTIKYSESANMFSNDTLLKLFDSEIKKEGITGRKSEILRLLRKSNPEKFFVLEFDDKYVIYRVPEKVTDLAPADKAKYVEAINGNTAMYTDKWRTILNNKNLIEREMKEILKFKTKQYPYNNPDDFHSVAKQPFFKIDPEGKTALPIRGLTPEEVLSTPETRAILRTNLSESYFYFLKGRYFELAFQKELDRMFGQTGITILDVFDYVEKASFEDFDRIAELANWSPEELRYAQKDLAEGLKRLREEYQFNADTLPYLNSETGYSARIGLAAIRFKFSAGYGISAFAETLIELAKQSPELYSIPMNVIKAMRYVFADYRMSKRKLLESDIGDMTFVLENFRTDLANRFMGEIGYGAFRSDSRLGTRVANSVLNIRDAQGIIETSTRTFEEAGKWMQSIGSLQSITNGTRALAKQRLQRMIWKYMSKGSIEKLFDALQESVTADELAALKKAASSDSKAEAALWKKFAGIARHEAKFGDPNEAALFLKYGLSTKEQIAHLRWAMEKAGHRDGRINIFNLLDIHEDLRDNPVDGFSPDILESAISAYAHMVEDLIIKTSTSELKGLNKITSLDSRSTFGRMFYALTSWVRAYQDNVILDFGSRSTIKYIASGIFLYAAMDTIIGLFKEWLAGRETEDIMQEFEDQPSQFVLRGVSRIPFLGIANGLVEAGASAISGMTGGSYQYYGVPLLPAGAGASMSAVQGIYYNLSDIVSDAVMKREANLKALSGLFGAETLINRSPIAIPARMLEVNNAFQEADAIQKYLELVHRNPYPYMDKAASRVKPAGIENELKPRNLDLERQQYLKDLEKRQQQQSIIRPPAIGLNDQKGVSGVLGDILGRSQ